MTDEIEDVDLPEIEEESTEAEPKEKSNLQARFDKITREKYQALTEAEQLRKEVEELRAKVTETKPKTPTLEEYDYDEEAHTQALIDAKVAAAVQETLRKQQTEAQRNAEVSQRVQKFAEKEAKFAQTVDDYDQVTRSESLMINDLMAEIIQTSDKGPEMAYFLGKNPQEAYRISRLPPIEAQRALLRIEAGAEAKPAITRAPDPVPDIGGEDVPVEDMDKLPPEQWMKRRNRQVHGR